MTEQDMALGLSRMNRAHSILATLDGTRATCMEVVMGPNPKKRIVEVGAETSRVEMTRGLFAVVDTERLHYVTHFNWVSTNGYATASLHRDGKRVFFSMHRLLWEVAKGDVPSGMVVDHVNRDKRDNRMVNLRVVSIADNIRNQSIRSVHGYRGVTRRNRRWGARIHIDGREIHLGYFDTPEQAARRYNDAAIASHQSGHVLNDV